MKPFRGRRYRCSHRFYRGIRVPTRSCGSNTPFCDNEHSAEFLHRHLAAPNVRATVRTPSAKYFAILEGCTLRKNKRNCLQTRIPLNPFHEIEDTHAILQMAIQNDEVERVL